MSDWPADRSVCVSRYLAVAGVCCRCVGPTDACHDPQGPMPRDRAGRDPGESDRPTLDLGIGARHRAGASQVLVQGAVSPITRGMRFYVDPASEAARQAGLGGSDAAAAARIAAVPQARWFGNWTPAAAVARDVRTYVDAAAADHAMPVVVTYAIPSRDCRPPQSSEIADRSGYDAWVRGVAAGIGARPAMVIVEPDALASLTCLGPVQQSARLAMLSDAVSIFARQSRTAVYIDAGWSGWQPVAVIARACARSGCNGSAGSASTCRRSGPPQPRTPTVRRCHPAWAARISSSTSPGMAGDRQAPDP